ncbi:MAG: PDZ domain-containing protein [Bacteroidetes bacterium]|nr:PDZ domain-containing protein [Bacteroidota bacterium]MBU1718177.1 PDZ domain-containing protein [Bacteroidota bacterium]
MIRKTFGILSIILFSGLCVSGQKDARLMRFPAIHGDNVVFSYAGDLYTVKKDGGIARKLTNDKGYEMFARFSPDGTQIAFTAQYDGNTEVYLIPTKGGVPKRITYSATLDRDDISDRMGPNNIVLTWTPDGKNVIFRSRMKSFNDFKGSLYKVPAEGGIPEQLPIPYGGFCSFNSDGSKLAFNAVFREFRTWKYYKGGMADDIRILDFKTKSVTNITKNPAQDIIPMWFGDKVYFLSDRDHTMNLFCYSMTSGETKKVTDFKEFDIKFPSAGVDAIVFENGGWIYYLDVATDKYTKIPVTIADDAIWCRNEWKDASKNITSASISPEGLRIAFSGRGDIYTVPVKEGVTYNLTKTPGIHERDVAWSPDGKTIAYISDESGEDEIYIIKEDGSGEPKKLTSDKDTYKYELIWSPDSRKLLWSDKLLRLRIVDVETAKTTTVATAKDWEFTDYCWAPDSKWIAWVSPERSDFGRIFIYNLQEKKEIAVTDSWYQSARPSFSDDGKYLYFSSNRDFHPMYSRTEWNFAYTDMAKVYFIALSKEAENPLSPENPEVGRNSRKPTKEAKDSVVAVKVDEDGLSDRIVCLPVDAGSYYHIEKIENKVYYIFRSSGDRSFVLKYFDLEKKKEENIGAVNGCEYSPDKKKMMIVSQRKYYVIDNPGGKVELKDNVDLSNMKVLTDLKQEWKQIYTESWRQMRDFFYDPKMHGVDWKAMYTKYLPLVEYAGNRLDLTYIIGELIGELNVGHAYTGGGDVIAQDRIDMGLLGATFIKDKSGYFKVTGILKGENWNEKLRSPFTEVGVNVNVGDFILAVNGVSLKEVTNIFQLLAGTAGKTVELRVNSVPDEKGARKELVVPVKDESQLYYLKWVRGNIERVNKATNGLVGYVHIPNMGAEGLNEFVKYFYPQLSKKALIVDDRGNGGGNVSPMIIERLIRHPVVMGMSRNATSRISPADMMPGPKVLLIDQYSASDGDLFPYRWKNMQLGPVIGVRSWGGVVGIRGSMPFIDGGTLSKPEFAHFDAEGNDWIIEGYGVDPDVVIENDAVKEFAGEDQQLDEAIRSILEEMKKNPPKDVKIPAFPNKSK